MSLIISNWKFSLEIQNVHKKFALKFSKKNSKHDCLVFHLNTHFLCINLGQHYANILSYQIAYLSLCIQTQNSSYTNNNNSNKNGNTKENLSFEGRMAHLTHHDTLPGYSEAMRESFLCFCCVNIIDTFLELCRYYLLREWLNLQEIGEVFIGNTGTRC